ENGQAEESTWTNVSQEMNAPSNNRIEEQPQTGMDPNNVLPELSLLGGDGKPITGPADAGAKQYDVKLDSAGKVESYKTEAGVDVKVGADGKPKSYNSNGFTFEKHDDGSWYYHQDSGGKYVKINEPTVASDGKVHAQEKGGWYDGREHSLDGNGQKTGDAAKDRSNDPTQVVANDDPKTVDDVLKTLDKLDKALPENDGLRWFNKLYTMVTEAVKEKVEQGVFQDPKWIEQLDVNFAKLYLNAIKANLNGEEVPKAWKALFDARHEDGIEPIQFALAGMIAHIDHDLAYGVEQTNKDLGINPGDDSPQHADFLKFNDVLKETLPASLELLNDGPIGNLADKTGGIGEDVALEAIEQMRNVAWRTSKSLHEGGLEGKIAAEIQDELSGALAEGVLVHV
ncbi:MAG: hypothetical protein K2X29_09500, partial [Candidatus Obscuribacterales bacterium]|nr:hypothetical protein [Candidatus Obscuribacterales bacterium]